MQLPTILTKFQVDNKSVQSALFYGGAAVLGLTSSFLLYKSLQKVSAYQHRPLTGENDDLLDLHEPTYLEKFSKMLPKPKFWG